MEQLVGTLLIQEEGRHALDNDGDIKYHKYEFYNYPKKQVHVWVGITTIT